MSVLPQGGVSDLRYFRSVGEATVRERRSLNDVRDSRYSQSLLLVVLKARLRSVLSVRHQTTESTGGNR